MREREKTEKTCLSCGKPIPNRNVYCNNKCQGNHKRYLIFKKIEEGDTSFPEESYKQYLIEKYGAKCMECEWNKVHSITGRVPIQLEHIDGNSDNHNLINLKLLCPNCHSLTPTFGALNKGNGRSVRKDKRNKRRNS